MSEPFEIKINALTPIWTGDADRKNSRLRETGIIGSLRWWYEAVVRGLGGYACDPTDTKCEFNYKAYQKTGNVKDGFVWKDKPEKNVCDACKLFGCTGWARKFRIEAKEGRDNNITLRFIEIKSMNNVELGLLKATLQIISKYGSLGAKMAESNGVVEINHNGLAKYNVSKDQVKKNLKNINNSYSNPNLKRFIFDIKYKKKELKDKFEFLKGDKGKGKKYFYKKYSDKCRFFLYAENSDEYSQIVDFFNQENVNFVSGEEVLDEVIK